MSYAQSLAQNVHGNNALISSSLNVVNLPVNAVNACLWLMITQSLGPIIHILARFNTLQPLSLTALRRN